MQLLSNAFSSGSFSPFRSAFSLTSFASFAVRKRRLRCWFIFALGATPSIAMKNSFLGLILPKRWSTYANMDVKICASDSRKCASSSLGWEPASYVSADGRRGDSWIRAVVDDSVEVDIKVV